MIVKHADKRTRDVAELSELLLLGITPQQRAAVDKEIHNVRRGVAGESGAAHYLDEYFHDSPDIAVLHDLRLVRDGRVMQIDHLLFTRDRQVHVIETKNYGGRLSCNDRGEWTAWYGSGRGKSYPIPSPVEQVLRQAKNLAGWFEARGIDTISEIHAMVMVLPTCSLPKNRDDGHVTVIKADNIRREWARRSSGSSLQAIWRKATSFSETDLLKFATSIARKHEPSERDWYARFGIEVPAQAEPAIEPASAAPAGLPAEPLSTETSAAMTPPSGPVAPIPVQPPGVVPATSLAAIDTTASTAAPAEPSAIPIEVETPFGIVTLKRIPKGSYALRHSGGDVLASHVREVVEGRARWQGLFRNWLVKEDDLADVIARLGVSTDTQAPAPAADRVSEAPSIAPVVAIDIVGEPALSDRAAPIAAAIPAAHHNEVETPFGVVTVKRIPDGSFALRHSGGDDLIAHVRGIACGRGRWQPRFRNWLVAEGDLADVVARLRAVSGAEVVETAR